MPRAAHLLAASAIVAAAVCWSNSACADSISGSGLAVVGAIVGHTTLVPAYASLIHYAANPKKRVPTAWTIANVTTSLLAGSLGFMITWDGAHANGNEQSVMLGCGVPLLATSTLVLMGTAVQSSRSTRPSWAAVPATILPYATSTASNGTNVGLMAVGQF